MSDTPQSINGELLRLKRESHGWLVSDMATRACMSVKQIRQLEEGGSSAFYSESVKLTSAKKVGAILGLTPNEVFGQPAIESISAADDVEAESNEAAPAKESTSHTHDALAIETQAQKPSDAAPTAADDVANVSPATPSEQKNKTPLGAIAALFVAALAVAAWMRPEAEPVAVEPPPPLQTLPAETPDGTASAAASAEAVAPAVVASSPASAPPAVSSPPAVTAPPASKPL